MLHPLWLWLFIIKLEMGVIGCGIANGCSYGIYFLFMTFQPLRMPELQESLFWPNMKDSFSKWGEFLELAVPGTLMVCFEWWCFEILILFSGYLGVNKLAANVILMNVAYFYLMIAYGTSEALSTLVGNCIGANPVALGKRITKLTVMVGAACFLTFSLLLILFKE